MTSVSCIGRAVVSDGQGSFEVVDAEISPPGPNEVVVEMRAAGLCRTDLDLLSVGDPHVVGHEGAGVIYAVGPGAGDIEPGDRVVLNWAIPCGRCRQCRMGAQSICQNRPSVSPGAVRYRGTPIRPSFGLGTMSTYAVVRREAVVTIDEDIPFPVAAVSGCAVMTGYGSAVNAARVSPGSSVVVLGAGGVGLNVVQGARICGASNIIAVDLNDSHLRLAQMLGATDSIRMTEGLGPVLEEVRRLTEGELADYAFDCTGVPDLAIAPLALIRNGGTAVQVSGVEQEVCVDMQLFQWNKTYINPLYGNCRPENDFPILFGHYRRGALFIEELITQTYPLAEVGQAFEDFRSGLNAKGVLVFE
ncbi:MAG: alcohol dehydrogenase catalytic domain-containing protein [Acidimicrobiia bacterium]